MTTSQSVMALAPSEITVLARAVGRAPSVHNTQPWILRFRGANADLVERTDIELPRQDPEFRDRALSCGAALAHLQLAARVLRRCDSTNYPAHGPVVATVHAVPGASPAEPELVRFHAIGRRRSHRRRFAADPVSDVDSAAVAAAGAEPGVCPAVPGNLGELGRLLGFATRVFRADRAYQRELHAWTAYSFGAHGRGAESGVPEAAFGDDSLPAAGLVRPATPVPDDARLADRLGGERLLFFCTDGDGRRDHLAAGAAFERAWLEATARGLAGSVLTQPLHLLGSRELLAERLGLPGLPQALFRFGHPVATVPLSPRRPITDLVRDTPLRTEEDRPARRPR
ncbi:nitroreductase family protein [Amycolatopsis rhabdoformis]|uniref:Nitroreductase family protein n=1 Tax=Amycolatopsis rhabdoformis TaxID=1448059 RepID=A0ABZ1ICQ4_9PSEU|nr:nitroreductase family protein [Amycolatopsis rhabdoformis]WSE32187.1 nitroreductase family protein [Amycolatopsis rhabdoformis]